MSAVDRWTLAHLAAGGVLALAGASGEQAAAVALVWELVQGPGRLLLPIDLPDQQPIENSVIDAGALVLGHAIVRYVQTSR